MNQILTSLKRTIFNIFGDMFFMFPDEYDEEELLNKAVPFPDNWLKYKIKITHNQEDYSLEFYFTPSQARHMAENFLGMEGNDVSQIIISETLKEAVNVMTGNLLNVLKKDYHLGIPESCRCEPSSQLLESFNPETDILIAIEGDPFLARIAYKLTIHQ